MNFEKWLDEQIARNPDDFDVDGESVLATMKRYRKSKVRYFLHEYVFFYRMTKTNYRQLDGLNTELGYVVFFLFYPVMVLILPPITSVIRYKKAMRDFRNFYENELNTGG